MNKLETKHQFVLLVLAILFLAYLYLRLGCNNMVKFSPAVITNDEWGINEAEYYSYFSDHIGTSKFKTKSETISFCINNKLGF